MVREIVIRYGDEQAVIVVNETILATADEYGTVTIPDGITMNAGYLADRTEDFLQHVISFTEWLYAEGLSEGL